MSLFPSVQAGSVSANVTFSKSLSSWCMSRGSTPWDKRILHRSFLHNPTSVLGFCWDGWVDSGVIYTISSAADFSAISLTLFPHTLASIMNFLVFFMLCKLDWPGTFQIVSAGSFLSSSPFFNLSFSSGFLLLGQEVLLGNLLGSISKFIACMFCFPPEWKNTI